jgi:hypothetical protein
VTARLAHLEIPPGASHVRAARLLAVAVARQLELDPEVVEDIRQAVGEACLLHLGGDEPIALAFHSDGPGSLTIEMAPAAEPSVAEPDSQIALTLLRSMVPDLDFAADGLRMRWPADMVEPHAG